MIPAHAVLAYILTVTSIENASSLEEKAKSMVVFLETDFSLHRFNKEVSTVQPPFKLKSNNHCRMLADQSKVGYVQHKKDDDEEKKKEAFRKKRAFIQTRVCHKDVNYTGNKQKCFFGKQNLRACGIK